MLSLKWFSTSLSCLLLVVAVVQAVSLQAVVRRGQVDGITYAGSSSGNDDCHVDGAAKYVRAVLTHTKADAKAIPTTEDVKRIEGPPGLLIQTASDRKSLLFSSVAGPQALLGGPLYQDKQPVYTVINATTVQANYTITAGLFNGTLPLTTAKIEEYFTYPDTQSCLISFIEAIFYIGQK